MPRTAEDVENYLLQLDRRFENDNGTYVIPGTEGRPAIAIRVAPPIVAIRVSIRELPNDLISKSEDPEKMLNQVVIDMANQLIEAKKQVAVSIADEKRLAKQAEQEAANAAEWERRAMLAIKSGDDALAKEALNRKKEHETLANTLK